MVADQQDHHQRQRCVELTEAVTLDGTKKLGWDFFQISTPKSQPADTGLDGFVVRDTKGGLSRDFTLGLGSPSSASQN